jgi:hypothetical protein
MGPCMCSAVGAAGVSIDGMSSSPGGIFRRPGLENGLGFGALDEIEWCRGVACTGGTLARGGRRPARWARHVSVGLRRRPVPIWYGGILGHGPNLERGRIISPQPFFFSLFLFLILFSDF